ncbi:MAG: cytochrome P450 [Verrucomicrobia bacterium]|nr:cytochrome P450 [Verrucomicrobiota bacterium]
MSTLPPGRSSWWHILPNTFAVMHDAPGIFSRMRADFGDPFLLRTYNGRIVFSSEPEALRALFTEPTDTFDIFGRRSLTPLLGVHSVLTNDHAPHTRARKLLIPPLHGQMLARLQADMRAAAEVRTAEARAAGEIDALAWCRGVALDVIFRAAFGVRDPSLHQRLRVALARMTDAIHPAFIFIPALQREWLPQYRYFLALRAEFDALLREATDAAANAPESASSVLSALVNARDEAGEKMTWPELRDQMVTILIAGHETSAVAMAWALHFIHARPEIEERLRAELAAAPGDSAAELPYLDAVCHEALRLYPILVEVLRQLAVPWEWCGFRLPAGYCVGAAIWTAHRREETYPEPETFRPERFLERKFSPFEFVPFGGGHRRCIGAAFALTEMRLVLRHFLQSGRWTLHDRTTPPIARRALLMVPATPITLRTAT